MMSSMKACLAQKQDTLESFSTESSNLQRQRVRSSMALSPSGSSKRVCSEVNNSVQAATCVVDGCTADLSNCRKYHQRHKVCEVHSKSPEVSIKTEKLRFCQQCSRFHPLDEFDEGKRSCRKRLDGHNRRRRKPRPYLFPVNHHGTGVVQSSGPPVHTAMASMTTSSLWSHLDHAPSLLSSSEASFSHVVHPPSGSFSATISLESDCDAGWGGMIDTTSNYNQDPQEFPFYWRY
ncbi:unnamed protein product [Lactuca virosa]|uniref:SBP-type domain-containing protein n=1 Tax=Lactuca virosa TaxID=75947 RepID=A0AAU9M599_9ASTR|nr:unnamed protein product [Lactuca virosa]